VTAERAVTASMMVENINRVLEDGTVPNHEKIQDPKEIDLFIDESINPERLRYIASIELDNAAATLPSDAVDEDLKPHSPEGNSDPAGHFKRGHASRHTRHLPNPQRVGVYNTQLNSVGYKVSEEDTVPETPDSPTEYVPRHDAIGRHDAALVVLAHAECNKNRMTFRHTLAMLAHDAQNELMGPYGNDLHKRRHAMCTELIRLSFRSDEELRGDVAAMKRHRDCTPGTCCY
jgi:hypothetical protein